MICRGKLLVCWGGVCWLNNRSFEDNPEIEGKCRTSKEKSPDSHQLKSQIARLLAVWHGVEIRCGVTQMVS